MKRRTLLVASGGGTLPLSGCLSSRRDDDPGSRQPGNGEGDTGNETGNETGADGGEDEREGCPYEECSREIIPYESLPTDVRAEVDAALAEAYESDSICLTATMDTDASYIEIDDTYYDPTVTGDGERLELREITPKALPDARPIEVTHDRDGERTITVVLTATDGETLVDETRTLHPGGEVEFGRTARVGSHDIRITVETDGELELEEAGSVTVTESRFSVLVIIDEEITISGTVAELERCRYDESLAS